MQRQKVAPVDGLQIAKARKIELLRETNQRGWLLRLPAGQCCRRCLESFQAKWIPVRRSESAIKQIVRADAPLATCASRLGIFARAAMILSRSVS